MQLKKILYIYSKLSQNYCYGKLEAEAKFNHPDFLLSTSHVRIQLKEIFKNLTLYFVQTISQHKTIPKKIGYMN